MSFYSWQWWVRTHCIKRISKVLIQLVKLIWYIPFWSVRNVFAFILNQEQVLFFNQLGPNTAKKTSRVVHYCNHHTRILYPPTEEKGTPWMLYWIKSMRSTLFCLQKTKNGCLFPFREKNVTPILCFWWSSSQEFIMMVWSILWYTLRRYCRNYLIVSVLCFL